jgi:D-aminopeptidase
MLTPGPLNAITDVNGVLVGHATLIEGDSVRTGVTAILPHGDDLFQQKVLAAVHTLNGYGKACGFEQVRELGTLETPLMLCSTLEVGRVASAVVDWLLTLDHELGRSRGSVNPVVAECFDGLLNDTRRRYVQREHVWAALEAARAGPVPEGNVGAGTGMSGFELKGGIGTSSRVLPHEEGGYTIGGLVVLNCGRRLQLQIAGVPVGRALADWPYQPAPETGSIIMVLATDAPLSARQLGRLARRAPLGLARTGAFASHSSGDFVIAFSTAQRVPHSGTGEITRQLTILAEEAPTVPRLFQAAVEATEEAIINALCMADTLTGRDGNVRHALPLDRLVALLNAHGYVATAKPSP